MRLVPPGPLRRIARSFLPSGVTAFSRPAYRWELTSVLFMPFALACVEGGVVGVIAKKGFGAGNLAISAITAAPALANVTSVLWTRFVHARDRVRLINAMQIGVIACVMFIALAPYNSPLGVAMLIAGMLAARILITGIVNARADLWAANYPKRERGRVTGNLTIVTTMLICVTSLAVGIVMSGDVPGATHPSHAFRYVYGVSALVALLGVWAFSRVHWRGRKAALKHERASLDGNPRAMGARAMLRVLKKDRTYRRFMWAQFWIGWPVMAADAPFIIALDDEFNLDYSQAIALTQVIPIFVAILVIPLWARFLDRVHIVHFRAYHSWVFVVALIVLGVGLLFHNLGIIYAGRVILGIAYGGGMLAWNLGHHDFASGGDSALYMGVHVTLTGVRGAFAPFLGTMIYAGSGFGATFHPLGAWTFLVMAIPTIYGSWMFVSMNHDIRAQRRRIKET